MLSGCFTESLKTHFVRYLEKSPVTGKRQSFKSVLRDMEFSDIQEISLYGKSSNTKWSRTLEGLFKWVWLLKSEIIWST